FWHKACFHCETCKMTLNMKNYKGYEKKPYCNAHYPKQSFTMVADTPENLRLKQQSELQSQIRYKEEFEKNKGKGFSVVADTPELQRIKKTQDQISNQQHPAASVRARVPVLRYVVDVDVCVAMVNGEDARSHVELRHRAQHMQG
ncbi:PREDICTED: LIM and SH3 domain protein 1-like, partial [Tauraco erythrolophus]|uniref:LIM and SH3 domain protein 1-like n=1 Tax=Tauraco erythrolophus TaxID=121530 RepID=UPI000523E9F7